jgi:carbamoyl-phosphate synthase large subunit
VRQAGIATVRDNPDAWPFPLLVKPRHGSAAKAVTVRSPSIERLAAEVCAALPGAYGAMTIQVFHDERSDDIRIIELNARFGGGFPLSREAGADFPRWMLEELAGLPSTASAHEWRDGLVMLRYDAAVFLPEAGHVE